MSKNESKQITSEANRLISRELSRISLLLRSHFIFKIRGQVSINRINTIKTFKLVLNSAMCENKLYCFTLKTKQTLKKVNNLDNDPRQVL